MSNYFNGKGTIGFTCDVCGRELNGCSIVNGMSFCEKCYQETFGKDNQQNEIKQLKQQLAEKDIRIEELEGQFAYECECNMQLVDLQKQLAEKDEEIERLNKRVDRYENMFRSRIAKTGDMRKDIELYMNQLAIQKLEKVNGILSDTIIEITQDEFDLNKLCYLEEISAKFYEKIQQQIKELKGEKDVKD